jgi:hypothetical protein
MTGKQMSEWMQQHRLRFDHKPSGWGLNDPRYQGAPEAAELAKEALAAGKPVPGWEGLDQMNAAKEALGLKI